jgi:prohibitin 1
VDIALRVLHKPIVEFLPSIYKYLLSNLKYSRNIGINYDEKILPSIANEVLKAVVA